MLLDDLYTIRSVEQLNSETTQFVVDINEHHAIFDGHFPEQPVMPGVCQIQMMTELVREIFKRDLELLESSMIKFLAFLDPRQTKEVTVKIQVKKQEENTISIISQIFNGESIFFKFSGTFS